MASHPNSAAADSNLDPKDEEFEFVGPRGRRGFGNLPGRGGFGNLRGRGRFGNLRPGPEHGELPVASSADFPSLSHSSSPPAPTLSGYGTVAKKPPTNEALAANAAASAPKANPKQGKGKGKKNRESSAAAESAEAKPAESAEAKPMSAAAQVAALFYKQPPEGKPISHERIQYASLLTLVMTIFARLLALEHVTNNPFLDFWLAFVEAKKVREICEEIMSIFQNNVDPVSQRPFWWAVSNISGPPPEMKDHEVLEVTGWPVNFFAEPVIVTTAKGPMEFRQGNVGVGHSANPIWLVLLVFVLRLEQAFADLKWGLENGRDYGATNPRTGLYNVPTESPRFRIDYANKMLELEKLFRSSGLTSESILQGYRDIGQKVEKARIEAREMREMIPLKGIQGINFGPKKQPGNAFAALHVEDPEQVPEPPQKGAAAADDGDDADDADDGTDETKWY